MERFEEQKLIEMGADEYCALSHAFAKNPEAVTMLKNAMDPEKLKLAADIQTPYQ